MGYRLPEAAALCTRPQMTAPCVGEIKPGSLVASGPSAPLTVSGGIGWGACVSTEGQAMADDGRVPLDALPFTLGAVPVSVAPEPEPEAGSAARAVPE